MVHSNGSRHQKCKNSTESKRTTVNKNIEIIINFRKHLLTNIDALNIEQLNFVPPNFNNNIVWNIGHLNAVLQLFCYKNSGLPLKIEEKYFLPFLSGTKPTDFINENEIKTIKQQLVKSPEELSIDLENGLFEKYKKVERIEKVYNIQVETINDAINYLTHHEGIHFPCYYYT